MYNPLVPESNLQQFSHRVRQFALDNRSLYSIDLDDPNYGMAFANYLFFAKCPAVGSVLGIEVDAKQMFYNAYFWFLRFESLYARRNGYDAGLKDQISDMLAEHSHLDLDPQVIQAVEEAATKLPP